MSTISSQLLVTASSVTEDFYKTFFSDASASDKELVTVRRAAVLGVAIIGILLSLKPSDTIF